MCLKVCRNGRRCLWTAWHCLCIISKCTIHVLREENKDQENIHFTLYFQVYLICNYCCLQKVYIIPKASLTYYNYTHCKNEMNSNATPVSSNLTQMQSARNIIENNKVSFDPRLHTFTIMGTTKPHVVPLFPKETCSYSSTSICYHIYGSKAKYWSR